MKLTAWRGLRAASTPGLPTTCTSPETARTANHAAMIGPKNAPIRSLPRLCTANSPTNTTMVIGITYGFRTEVATCSPSTALRTEMAGVIIPSP